MDESVLNPVRIRALALAAGFSEAGIVALPHLHQERDAERFNEFAAEGHAGTMEWLTRKAADGQRLRAYPLTPFPWARSALVCLVNYKSAEPNSIDPAPEGTGWIARYAITGKWVKKLAGKSMRPAESEEIPANGDLNREDVELVPSDYHRVLLKRLRSLESALKNEFGDFESRAYVDTGPVVERSLAVAAGLGWTGKNTCLIHPQLGSWSFLCVLLTSLELPERTANLIHPDRCGSCRRCLDACPTDALYEPYKMNASRCIAYLTIEHRGTIPQTQEGVDDLNADSASAPDLPTGIGRQIFGCDICQDVCPWNRKSPIATDPELVARNNLVNPSLESLAELDVESFEQVFNGSPVRRTGFDGFRRNLAIAMGNSRIASFANRLLSWSHEEDAGLRTAALWALTKLNQSADETEQHRI
jgi:epoxyqueuosine reductase